jgi:predicted transcriptional regulator
MPNPTVALRLDEHTQSRLKNLAQKRDRSPHYLMKEAVETFLALEESVEAERELMQARWDRFALTGEAIAHEDVKAWAEALSPTPQEPQP